MNARDVEGAQVLVKVWRDGHVPADYTVKTLLLLAGCGNDDADELLSGFVDQVRGEMPDPPAPVRLWTDDELEQLKRGLAVMGWKLPSVHVVRAVADQLERTTKSVQSQMERQIRAHQEAVRAATRWPGTPGTTVGT